MIQKTYDYSTSLNGLSFIDRLDGWYEIQQDGTAIATENFGSHFTLVGTGFADEMEAFAPGVELQGGDGDDLLLMFGPDGTARGGAGSDLLIGGLLEPAADHWVTLDGGAGDDHLIGLEGNTRFLVDSQGDVVEEDPGNSGTDVVVASTSYQLGRGQGIETLELAADTGTATLSLTGNEFANTLIGNDGQNTLIGGGGDDVMIGQGGNDFYGVGSPGDRVVEAVGGGYDVIIAGCSYRMEAGQEIEAIRLLSSTGTASLSLFGNEFDNKLVGNAGANFLQGGGGDDRLLGEAGRDRLYGGEGDDRLDGGLDGDWLNQIDHQVWRVVSVDRSISEDLFFLDTMPSRDDFVFA